MRTEEDFMVLVFGTGAVLGLMWIIGKVISGIASLFAPSIPEEMPDQIAVALQTVSTPMQLPGGRWGRYETKLVECDAPMSPNDLTVHDRNAPGHDARTCKHCQPSKGFSGVNLRHG